MLSRAFLHPRAPVTFGLAFAFPCAPFRDHLCAIQAVYNIITGTYPCSEEEAVQLAALQFQVKFGKHNPAS